MKTLNLTLTLALVSLFLGCKDEPFIIDIPHEYEYSFDTGTEGWKSFFSDYPVGEEEFYELTFEKTHLPEPLDQNEMALKISGNNHSDDLFSAIYRKFDHLKPNTTYSITFELEIASNVSTSAIGIGGSPNLALGAGGVNYLPQNTTDNLDHYRPNFESKLQSGLSNDVFKVLGNIGVSEENPTHYMLVNRNNIEDPFSIKSNANGEIWLMIATDSGFEGITTLFYNSIKIKIE